MNLLPFAQETLYFQNAAGKLFHHSAGFVRLVWNSERTSTDIIKAFYEQVLALLLNSGSQRILSDHGQRAPLTSQTQEWLTENWIPRAITHARTRHCAIVDGHDPLHRLSTQTVVVTSPSGFIFRRFSSVKEAEGWLLGSID